MKCLESDLMVCCRTLFGAFPCPEGYCSLEEFEFNRRQKLHEQRRRDDPEHDRCSCWCCCWSCDPEEGGPGW